MTLLLRDEEKRAEGRAEGRIEGFDLYDSLFDYITNHPGEADDDIAGKFQCDAENVEKVRARIRKQKKNWR